MRTGKFVSKAGVVVWLNNNVLHNVDGPAVVWPNGQKEWWVNGLRHREDGPALITAAGTKEWFMDGNRHREDGPAIESMSGYDEWWFDGTLIDVIDRAPACPKLIENLRDEVIRKKRCR